MITANSNKQELLTAIEDSILQLQNLLAALDDNSINIVPYEDSWTAGQLLRHVERSISGMAKSMATASKPAVRDPGEKIAYLKELFLDLSKKMKSPEFIAPGPGPYNKATASAELNKAGSDLKSSVEKANLGDIVEGLPFGEVTKLEMLHFILYHTQRHLQQMEKITAALLKH